LSTGGGHLVRADGSPRFTMTCNLTGAIINTILDAIFVFGFQWGMAGAAAATIIGQCVAGCMVIRYLRHCKTVELKKEHFIPQARYISQIAALGAAPCSNQLAMMIVQIVMNNSLKKYGAASVYGESIPIACSGIGIKISQVFFSFIIGLSQGLQPIVSYNYGAKKYDRVKEAYLRTITYGGVLSVAAFALFQIFPRQIISAFGNGSEIYYQFAVAFFRIFLFFTFLNFMQPITSNFFTATGFPKKGMFLSLTRQILFLLPLLLILPKFFGIDGILYAGPIADGMAGAVAIGMIVWELRKPIYRK
jgi:Na+-driven multidrug efflux pump